MKLSPLIVGSQIVAGSIIAMACLRYICRKTIEAQKLWLNAGLLIAVSVYVIFAVFSENVFWIGVELTGGVFFTGFVVLSVRYSYWFLALAWLLHAFWGAGVQPQDIAPYVPQWYPAMSMGFDLVISGYVAFKLANSK